MSLIAPDGEILQLSVSQVEKADPQQTGGCLRRWWFETPQGLKPEQSYVQNEGTAGHELLRRYLIAGENPRGRTLMGKAVTGAILKGALPTPGPDLIVEKRFSGQDMRNQSLCECGHQLEEHNRDGCMTLPSGCTCTSFRPAWVPLDVAKTLHLAGVPWDGAIDLVHRRGERPVVLDHKFSSDPELYAKKNSELIRTVQMPVYAHSQRARYPDAREFELVHHYVSKRGVTSFMRRAVVTVEQLDERIADVVAVVERMKAIAPAQNQDDVAASPGPACEAWNGCPHQSICSAFKRRNTNPRGATTMALSPEEEALFNDIPVDDAAPAAQPEIDELPPADESDEVAKLKAQLEAAQQKQAAAKPPRRIQIHDVPAPEAESTAEQAPPPCSKCGAAITAENGSKLRDGTWKHVGCLADKPAAPPPPPSAKKKKNDAPPPPPPPPPPAAEVVSPTKTTVGGLVVAVDANAKDVTPPKVFAGERQTERDATAALDAVQQAKPPAATAPVQVLEVKAPAPAAVEHMLSSLTTDLEQAGALEKAKRHALASVFDSIAALLRAA